MYSGGLTHNGDKCEGRGVGGWAPPEFNGGVILSKVAYQVKSSTGTIQAKCIHE